jgi:Holliday junction resolvase-like predicted endonuclease
MSTVNRGSRNQQVGRAGELFVAAELNKRGAIATLYLTSTPRVDVVATDPDQHNTVSIQVKTKSPRSRVWQANIEKLKRESREAAESDFLILVDLGDEKEAPTYYICPLRQFAAQHVEKHNKYLAARAGKRPRNPRSPHTAITMDEVSQGQGRWDRLQVLPTRQASDT